MCAELMANFWVIPTEQPTPIMLTILLGLFGGAGATLLWEGFLKPLRERRNVAELLAAEVSLNLQLLGAAKIMARPDKIPTDFEPSTMVFDAVADKVGELPTDAVREVVFLYRYFKQLSAIVKTYSQYVDNIRNTSPDSSHILQMRKEAQMCIDIFNSSVEKSINRANITQPLLLANATPWWSLRQLRREPSRQLTFEELAERTNRAFQERAELSEAIRHKHHNR